MQLDIDGAKLVEEAITAFKALPRMKQMKIINSLDKVRAELMDNMEAHMPPLNIQTEDESKWPNPMPSAESRFWHVAPHISSCPNQPSVQVQIHHQPILDNEGETHIGGSDAAEPDF